MQETHTLKLVAIEKGRGVEYEWSVHLSCLFSSSKAAIFVVNDQPIKCRLKNSPKAAWIGVRKPYSRNA